MKKSVIVAALLAGSLNGSAAAPQQAADDPVVMVINGQPVLRSEFEYSFNKNNSEGVIDKKSIEEYVELFVNYKMKVCAAIDAKYDTLTSYKQEFAQYRNQQILPLLVNENEMMAEAHNIYNRTAQSIGPDGLIQVSHILLRLDQKASEAEKAKAKARIDSVSNALKQGADFAELAKKVSQDPGSAAQGGLLPFVYRGQLVKEFEDIAFAMKPGEVSDVVETPYGYHIIRMESRKEFEPFDFHKENILKFMEQRNVREQLATKKVEQMAAQSDGKLTVEAILDQKSDSLAETDMELKNLIREYHDGLLLYEVSNERVWDKAAKDEEGLARYFKKNKKKYDWTDGPRFKGIAYHVKDQADVEAVKKSVKGLAFDKWADRLRVTFNADSVLRIRVEKGIFKMGDNALVDSAVFKKDTVVTKVKGYPIDAVYGTLLKKGPEDYTDVKGLVTTDYQDLLEREWVAELRRKYTYSVNQDVLKTVNNH